MFQYIDNFHYFFYISGHFPGQINRKKDSVTNYQVSQWRLWMDRWAEGKRGKYRNWVIRSINRRLFRLLAPLSEGPQLGF